MNQNGIYVHGTRDFSNKLESRGWFIAGEFKRFLREIWCSLYDTGKQEKVHDEGVGWRPKGISLGSKSRECSSPLLQWLE